MKIPFDIKYRPQIESGDYKVETRDGRPVRIVCWERKCGFPVTGLAYHKEDERENYVNARIDGTASIGVKMESLDDLFIVTHETEFGKEDKFLMNELSAFLQNYVKEYDDDAAVSDVARHFYKIGKKQKEQKPAEWSEEDEKFFNTALWHMSYSISCGKSTNIKCDTTDWLKGIRERIKSNWPQHHWKPSKEQMEALMLAIEGKCPPTSYMSRRLEDLYEVLANEYNVECKLENSDE